MKKPAAFSGQVLSDTASKSRAIRAGGVLTGMVRLGSQASVDEVSATRGEGGEEQAESQYGSFWAYFNARTRQSRVGNQSVSRVVANGDGGTRRK